jgi:hypothetical protein
MNKLKIFLLFPVVFLIPFDLASRPTSEYQRRPRASEGKSPQLDRSQILEREWPKLADSALAIKNLELRISTLAALADALWSGDSTNARLLFHRTYGLLRAIEPTDDRQSANSNEAKLPTGKLITLYVHFFSFLAKHDLALKEQFASQAPDFFRDPGIARNLDAGTANLLIKDGDPRAFDFIEASISGGVSGFTKTMQVLELLVRFRRIDAKKADQLFLQVMRQLEGQSDTSADDLLTIGNYLFTTSFRAPGVAQDMLIVSPVYVGRVSFHADISVDRPEISPEIVEEYLRSSVVVLTRQVNDEKTVSQNRAAAFLLLPKARRFAQQYVAILGNLATGIDPNRTNSTEARSSALDSAPSDTLDAVIDRLDRINDRLQKDEYCLRMIWFFYSKDDFKSARALNERMSLPEIREKVAEVISIRQAIQSLQVGDINSARLQAKNLPQCKERSFLWLAIAARMIEKGSVINAKSAIELGLIDARTTSAPNRASLLLLATELTSSIDFPSSLYILSEALTVMNSLDAGLNNPLRFDRFVRVRVGSQSATFSTDINGAKSGTIKGALKAPVAKDPNGAITLILQLKNDYLRSSALLAFVTQLTT